MGLVKLPRVIWKTFCERGIMESLVGEEGRSGEKIHARLKQLKKRNALLRYHVLYAVCELLNIIVILVCFYIINSLLNGSFWSYGADVNEFFSTKQADDNKFNPGLQKSNPMCSLFPTEVACNYCTGSVGGGCNDKKSHLCILSNNLFNQYFFLILWFWWVFLLVVSCLGFVYRVAQMFIPAIAKIVLESYLMPYGLELSPNMKNLTTSDYFLLGRISINIKGSTMKDVLSEFTPISSSEEVLMITTKT